MTYPHPVYARLRSRGSDLEFDSSFDRALVDDFRRMVPESARRWDAGRRVWIVAASYGQTCADLAKEHLGVHVTVPNVAATVKQETRLLRLEYLGRTKQRGIGDSSAYGWADGSWCLVFPESVLRDWFDAVPQSPGEKPTLFAVLMVKPQCSLEELRSAYRRMVKIWHPDVNRSDPDAAEQFKVVQHAWEVLSDPLKRRKYEAGLSLQIDAASQRPTRAEQLGTTPWDVNAYDTNGNLTYRSPLRCGWVLAEGIQSLGRFVAAKILAWEDITQGDTVMVSSWAMGDNAPTVSWQ